MLRVPIRHILKIKIFNFILQYTPLEGGFYGCKKVLPYGPYMPGNRMRNLLNKFKKQAGLRFSVQLGQTLTSSIKLNDEG